MTRSSTSPVRYRFGRFDLQPGERRLLAGGEPVVVGPRAFDVLIALVERAGELVSKEELLERVWPKLVVEENNLQVQVSSLRKLLGLDAVATIPGRGYRFTLKLERADASGWRDGTMPSIAVLPFVNVSDDVTNEYFADGLSEELLNVLAKIQGLHVASRTSAFSFKGTKVDIPTVAQKLNVATILQGSVRKSGRRVRIAVQLIRADTDAHLWSETYDRELDDIFAVQDDIAQSVVKELRSALLGEKPDESAKAAVKAEVQAAAKGRGQNAEAYRLYLQGRFFVDRSTREDVTKGIEYLLQAVDLDPEYALGWAALARAYASQASFAWAPFAEGFEQARVAAQRAVVLEPELAEGHAALGWVRLSYDWDWSGADASLHRALELAPGNAEVVREAAFQAGCLGRHEDAVALAKRSVVLDPLSVQALRTLCIRCVHAGLLDDAEAAIERALELLPNASRTHYHLGLVRLAQARLDEALTAFAHEVDDDNRLVGLVLVQHARGRQLESDTALAELVAKHSDGCAYQIAEGYAYRGEVTHAFNWLGVAYARHDPGLSFVKADPLLVRLRTDSRWQPFLVKIGLDD
jgi:adenylate cyclase